MMSCRSVRTAMPFALMLLFNERRTNAPFVKMRSNLKSNEDSHTSSSEATPIWVVTLVLVIVFLMIIVIFVTAFLKRRPLQRMCQRLQARLSLQDIRGDEEIADGGGDDVEDIDRNHLPATAVLIESPQHDPQNVLDYQLQMEVDLKLARSSRKNVQTGIFAAQTSGQITSLVHAELQESMKMGPSGIDIHETLLKTM